jgi:hypothetical protein
MRPTNHPFLSSLHHQGSHQTVEQPHKLNCKDRPFFLSNPTLQQAGPSGSTMLHSTNLILTAVPTKLVNFSFHVIATEDAGCNVCQNIGTT